MAIATQMGPKDDEPVPVIETTEEVCVFLNTGKGARVDGFRKAGYFTYGDVVVCVEGTREATIQKLNSTRATSGANWVNATQGEEEFLKAEQVAAAEAGRAKR